MGTEKLWTVKDVAEYLGTSQSWVYKRTAPNTRFWPKIPRVAHVSHPRFDPRMIKELFSVTCSLKIERGKSSLSQTLPSDHQEERKFKRL